MSKFSDMMDRLKAAKKNGTTPADKPAEYDKFGAIAHGASEAGYPPDQAAAMANKATGTYTGDDDD